MPARLLEHLLFAQGGLCFFCQRPLSQPIASVEHIVATANGGTNHQENCVVCCKALNTLLGRMSLKEKLRVVLNQKGEFTCPDPDALHCTVTSPQTVGEKVVKKPSPPTNSKAAGQQTVAERIDLIEANLRRQGRGRPRRIKSLSNAIADLFRKQLSEQDIELLVRKLESQGIISISGTTLTYPALSKGD